VNDALPLVSVVTPSLNQGRFIEATIRSVAEQDYPRVEHIVIDGGSTDGTVDVLQRYGHLRWISEADGGQSEALNKGFAMAEGEILGWLNADDVYLPGAIAASAQALRDTGCALVYGGWIQLDEAGNLIREISPMPWDYRLQLEVRNGVSQPGTLFTRNAFESVGRIDASYRYAMDYELWLRLGARYDVRCIERPLAGFRVHSTSKSVAEAEGFRAETWRAARSHGARLRSPLFLDYYLPAEHPWAFRLLIAWRHLRHGEVRKLAARTVAHLNRRSP
jgi:glycosyltransferase involved in cell wall biosynthesis